MNELDFTPENTAGSSDLDFTVTEGNTQGLVLQIISEPGLWNHFKVGITHMLYLIHYTKPL